MSSAVFLILFFSFLNYRVLLSFGWYIFKIKINWLAEHIVLDTRHNNSRSRQCCRKVLGICVHCVSFMCCDIFFYLCFVAWFQLCFCLCVLVFAPVYFFAFFVLFLLAYLFRAGFNYLVRLELRLTVYEFLPACCL